jgi:hypothetical protein
MKTFGLLLCMALVAGTLMAAPIPAPNTTDASAIASPALLQAIFGEACQANTPIDLMSQPSDCGNCHCDPGQACHLYSNGSCSCG